jgi:hypothetical protein
LFKNGPTKRVGILDYRMPNAFGLLILKGLNVAKINHKMVGCVSAVKYL